MISVDSEFRTTLRVDSLVLQRVDDSYEFFVMHIVAFLWSWELAWVVGNWVPLSVLFLRDAGS